MSVPYGIIFAPPQQQHKQPARVVSKTRIFSFSKMKNVEKKSVQEKHPPDDLKDAEVLQTSQNKFVDDDGANMESSSKNCRFL